MACQLIPGYQELVELARRTGEVKDVYARIVYANEKFEWHPNETKEIVHEAMIDGELGAIRCVYACAVFKDGYRKYEVLRRSEVEKIRNSSKGYRPGFDSPWTTHEEEMFKKTAIRRICKGLPQSSELAQALSLVDTESRGVPQNLNLDNVLEDTWTPPAYDEDAVIMDGSEHQQTDSEKAADKVRQTMLANDKAAKPANNLV